ncbi:MAG: VWA domain-containing protein [Myxococcales bacterium]|nr:VWA domain-containing protein [Myxococcales bacterium]
MTLPATHLAAPHAPHASNGGRLVTADGRELPLRAVGLAVEAAAGIARVVVTQHFHNPFAEPLSVSYELPLPAEGAVSGFSFELDGRRIVGEVDKKQRARERFEQAVLAGHSAALLEQDRSSLFRQEIGNVPPGSDIVAEIVVDQKLRWLAEGEWEWRFPTVVAPRYVGAEGRVADGARVTVDVADGPLPVRATLCLRLGDALGRPVRARAGGERARPTAVAADARVASPSHALAVTGRDGAFEVAFADERGARLDRDVVVRWPVATDEVGARLVTARPAAGAPMDGHAYGLLTLVPPAADAVGARVARDLTLLVDASGSMHGEPLEQVRRVGLALLATLDADDSLEMIAFGNAPRRFRPGAERVTAALRREAEKWLRALRAEGGTEMKAGILAALEPLRAGAQRQIVLFTDGLIGFEQEIVRTVLERLAGCQGRSRVHSVGVGSAVNRTLTLGAARAGRGVEAVIGLGEDPERAALRLCAHTAAPLVVELEVAGSALRAHAPRQLPDLYAGAPALVSLELEPEGGELRVRGRTASGRFEQRLVVAPVGAGEGARGIAALYGREAVEDLEMLAAAGERGVERAIEELGLAFQLATRMTSWVAVSTERTVDPREPLRRTTIPQELPHGMSAEGLGLRAARPALAGYALAGGPAQAVFAPGAAPARAYAPPAPSEAPADDALFSLHELAELEQEREKREELAPPRPVRAAGRPRTRPAPAEPAAAEPQKQKAKSGLFGRVADGLRRAFSAGEAAPLAVVGRVVVHDDAGFVVELELPEPLEWAPEAVVVVLADGTRVAAEVLVELTTRAGAHAAGVAVRLALQARSRLEGGTDWIVHPERIELRSAGRQVVIAL